MKEILTFLGSFLTITLVYSLVAPFVMLAYTAWIWLPVVFDLYNLFGGACLGFVIGIVILVAATITHLKVFGDE